jgi:apolipoprotein N-acyltransferase
MPPLLPLLHRNAAARRIFVWTTTATGSHSCWLTIRSRYATFFLLFAWMSPVRAITNAVTAAANVTHLLLVGTRRNVLIQPEMI